MLYPIESKRLTNNFRKPNVEFGSTFGQSLIYKQENSWSMVIAFQAWALCL